MGSCYKLSIIHITEGILKHQKDGTKIWTKKIPFCDRMFDPHPEAREILDKILAKYDKDSWGFFFHLDDALKRKNLMPWVMIFFDDAMGIGGHLLSIRDKRDDLRFTDISIPYFADIEKINLSRVSMILVKSKEILYDLTAKTPVFNSSWELLKDKDEHQHWICFSDAPPNDWLLKTTQVDEELYKALKQN
jgi:hypothetical protein